MFHECDYLFLQKTIPNRTIKNYSRPSLAGTTAVVNSKTAAVITCMDNRVWEPDPKRRIHAWSQQLINTLTSSLKVVCTFTLYNLQIFYTMNSQLHSHGNSISTSTATVDRTTEHESNFMGVCQNQGKSFLQELSIYAWLLRDFHCKILAWDVQSGTQKKSANVKELV